MSSLSDKIAALTSAFNLKLHSDEMRHIFRNMDNLNILKSIARFEINVPRELRTEGLENTG